MGDALDGLALVDDAAGLGGYAAGTVARSRGRWGADGDAGEGAARLGDADASALVEELCVSGGEIGLRAALRLRERLAEEVENLIYSSPFFFFSFCLWFCYCFLFFCFCVFYLTFLLVQVLLCCPALRTRVEVLGRFELAPVFIEPTLCFRSAVSCFTVLTPSLALPRRPI